MVVLVVLAAFCAGMATGLFWAARTALAYEREASCDE